MNLGIHGFPPVRISPFFPWEKKTAWLTVRTRRAFHPFHVTTRLCLELLGAWKDRLFQAHTRFLDVGCGTGILALAAVKLGAARAVGVDISGSAIACSRENARLNGLCEKVWWVHGSVEALGGSFSCVAANVPWTVWESLLDAVTERVAHGGALIASGFQDIHAAILEGRLKEKGLNPVERRQGDLTFFGVPPSGSFTWCALLAVRSSKNNAAPPGFP
ncbi:MAG: 50S ribosomal protein L11 methyltransferase [Desulfosoma sp.]